VSGSDAPAVLVVDDSAVVRLAVTRRLKEAGLDVVEQATAAPPDGSVSARIACALLDLDLGEARDGTDLAQDLRAARPDLPLAFFSASAAEGSVARATALGPVFAKPAQLDDAIAWVRANAANAASAK
jgi:CheY-like chemotaxis protein